MCLGASSNWNNLLCPSLDHLGVDWSKVVEYKGSPLSISHHPLRTTIVPLPKLLMMLLISNLNFALFSFWAKVSGNLEGVFHFHSLLSSPRLSSTGEANNTSLFPYFLLKTTPQWQTRKVMMCDKRKNKTWVSIRRMSSIQESRYTTVSLSVSVCLHSICRLGMGVRDASVWHVCQALRVIALLPGAECNGVQKWTNHMIALSHEIIFCLFVSGLRWTSLFLCVTTEFPPSTHS